MGARRLSALRREPRHAGGTAARSRAVRHATSTALARHRQDRRAAALAVRRAVVAGLERHAILVRGDDEQRALRACRWPALPRRAPRRSRRVQRNRPLLARSRPWTRASARETPAGHAVANGSPSRRAEARSCPSSAAGVIGSEDGIPSGRLGAVDTECAPLCAPVDPYPQRFRAVESGGKSRVRGYCARRAGRLREPAVLTRSPEGGAGAARRASMRDR